METEFFEDFASKHVYKFRSFCCFCVPVTLVCIANPFLPPVDASRNCAWASVRKLAFLSLPEILLASISLANWYRCTGSHEFVPQITSSPAYRFWNKFQLIVSFLSIQVWSGPYALSIDVSSICPAVLPCRYTLNSKARSFLNHRHKLMISSTGASDS